ncbi:MAG: FG-GAP-like repeat-containing protein [Euryarchaeota archaeon]|nr:FG-GAP-like repeat-containing protein [Euryarchaeota archaeon]
MKQHVIATTLLLLILLAALTCAADGSEIAAPVLKWQQCGCYNSWCETGWYSSPAVADLDSDGDMEIIASAYSVVALDGETGDLLWRVKSGHDRSEDPGSVDNVGRTWSGIVIADVDNDGEIEIVTAHGGGYVSVYNREGYFEPGWPQHPAGNEFRSLAVSDLDGDGDMEIAVGLAKLTRENVWVFEHDGSIRSGWPQLIDEECSAAGIYNDNIGAGDIDSDGLPELIVPSDTITICAYKADGTHIGTNEMYHDHSGHDMDHWGEVPAYINLSYETRGWGPCYQEFTVRANFANGPANVVDVNGDCVNEIVVIGDVHDCHTSPYTDLYNTPYILNSDRSRFNTDGFDWTTPPIDTGTPIIQDYGVIESVQPNPVTVDLDGDGRIEILYPSYDGRMHAFWLDKTEHGNWPYSVYDASEGFYRFATEPVVADLDNDGSAEVIFGSWVQKGTERTGKLHILDYLGNVIHEMDLPPAKSGDWNGVLAAPTLEDIDGDSDLELVLNTAHSGVVAYDLPGTAGARVLWGTGRGSYHRTGESLVSSTVSQKGDLNFDGRVTVADVLLALKIAVSGEYSDAADINCDGRVTALDARLLLHHVANPEKYTLNCMC